MNTQKKRGPLEVSDERFEKTPWTSLTPQGARQGRVPSSKASNLKERHSPKELFEGELHSPLQRSSSRRELFERDTTFGMSMLVFVVEETEQGTMCKTYVYSPCWIEATDLLLS